MTSEVFKPTAVQQKALELLSSAAKHVLLFGGSRSGKTTVLVMAIIFRACRYPGSRHLICRFRAKDARSSVLHETLLPWLNKTIGAKNYKANVHDGLITLWNGSEIWIGGLGDKEQVDRICFVCYNYHCWFGSGEMAEWFKALVLKTSDAERHRGFESLSLRQYRIWRSTQEAEGAPLLRE